MTDPDIKDSIGEYNEHMGNMRIPTCIAVFCGMYGFILGLVEVHSDRKKRELAAKKNINGVVKGFPLKGFLDSSSLIQVLSQAPKAGFMPQEDYDCKQGRNHSHPHRRQPCILERLQQIHHASAQVKCDYHESVETY